MFALLCIIAVALAGVPGTAPFEDSPKALLAEAVGREENTWVEMVLEDHRYSVEADGRLRHERWRIYQVRSAEAAEQWGHVGATWQPWFQDRPEIQARVITPDGQVFEFDPGSLIETTEDGGDPLLYSDEKTIRAPLSKVEVGGLVETVVVWTDHRPRFDRGRAVRHWVEEARHHRVAVDVPRDTALSWSIGNLGDARAKESTRRGRKLVQLEVELPDGWPEGLAAPPADHVPWPYLAFSTVPSWTAVGEGYAAMIAGPLADELPAAWSKAVAGAPDREAKIRTAFEIARDELRYTGLELGEQSLVPRLPSEVAASGYGDCKDKATLAVALLEAEGIDASLALIRSGGSPVFSDLPGIDLFNHAILFVAPDIFLDPTDSWTPYGEVPAGLRGRQALVVDSPEALRRIPWTSAAENYVVETRELRIPHRGSSTVREHSVGAGWLASTIRPPDRKAPGPDDYSQYATDAYAGTVTAVSSVNHELGPGPAELTLELDGVEIGVGHGQSAEAFLAVDQWTAILPEGFWSEIPEDRTVPFVSWPFHHEVHWRVEPPQGMVPVTALADVSKQFGPLSLSVDWELADGGVIEGTVVFDTGDGVVAVDDLRAMQTWARTMQSGLTIQWQQEALAQLAGGDVVEAIETVDRLIAAHPAEAEYRGVRGLILTRLGLREPAVAELEAARELVDNQGILAWWASLCLMHDPLGRDSAKGLDAVRAAPLLREAHAALPDDLGVVRNLGLVLLFDAQGNRYSPGPALGESLEQLERAQEGGMPGLEIDLAILLLRTGQPERAIALLEEVGRVRAPAFVAAVAQVHGVEAARRHVHALGLTPQEAGQVLSAAAVLLTAQRDYATVHGLGSAAEMVLPGSGTVFERLGSWEEVDRADPVGAVLALNRGLLAGELDNKTLKGLMSKRLDGMDDLDALGMEADSLGYGPEGFLDLLAALSTVVEADPEVGARVRMGQGEAGDIFLVKEREWKIRSAGRAMSRELAVEAAFHLEKGRLEAGRKWLQWTLDQMPMTAALELYGRLDPNSPEQLLFLARTLGMSPDEPVPELDLEVLPEQAREVAVRLVAGIAMGQRRHDARTLEWMTRHTELTNRPDSWIALGMLHMAAGNEQAAREAVDKARPMAQDPAIKAALLHADATLSGDPQAVMDQARALAAVVEPRAPAANEVAWYLAFGDAEDRKLGYDLARRSLASARSPSVSWLHTVATLQVEQGDYAGAMHTLRAASPVSDKGLTLHFDYVRGRLAEVAGLPEVARDYYEHVIAEDLHVGALTTRALAEARLSTL